MAPSLGRGKGEIDGGSSSSARRSGSTGRSASGTGGRSILWWLLAGVAGVSILAVGIWAGLRRGQSPGVAPTPMAAAIPTPDDGAASWYGRTPGEPNKLGGALTPYLRNAAGQPVNWHEWGPEAFALAQELDRPILLDIGASWCVACDLMDRQSYDDPAVAAMINGSFVPVRVDRDARPDVDARFQATAQALGSATGWPLTLVLTPDGGAYAGGTYFPPDQAGDQQGLKQFLPAASAAYYQKRADVIASAKQVHDQAALTLQKLQVPGAPSADVENAIRASMMTGFDSINAGWGRGGRTAAGPAIAYALAWHGATNDPKPLELATRTLDAVAAGSLRDHVNGGIFRFTDDSHWQQPHFEKMSYLNADAIANYARAYEITGNARYRDVLAALVDYVETRASDQRNGGFFASQASHAGTGVDAYYTWTLDEAKAALTPEQAGVVLPRLGIQSPPSRPLQERPDRNVLYEARPVEDLAAETGRPVGEVQSLIEAGLKRMAEARSRETAPPFDATVYAGWNARCVSAYLQAANALGRPALQDFAVKTTDFLLANLYEPGKGIRHGYGAGQALPNMVMEDQVLAARALLDVHAATGDRRYLDAARDLFDTALARYEDTTNGGLVDAPDATDPLASLPPVPKPILDGTTASANAVAAMVALRLADATGEASYRQRAEKILGAFGGSAGLLGPMGASYAHALLEYLAASPDTVPVVTGTVPAESPAATSTVPAAVTSAP